jgi:hypothetical protein
LSTESFGKILWQKQSNTYIVNTKELKYQKEEQYCCRYLSSSANNTI